MSADVIELFDDDGSDGDVVFVPEPACPRCTTLLTHAGALCVVCTDTPRPSCPRCTVYLHAVGAACRVCSSPAQPTTAATAHPSLLDSPASAQAPRLPPTGRCRRLHALVHTVGVPLTYPRNARLACDACAESLGNGRPLYHCATCQFDLCVPCNTLLGSGRGHRGTSARAAAMAAVREQEPPDSAFTDAVSKLREALDAASHAAAAHRPAAALCANADFYSQAGTAGAGWACGYRCAQMLMSSLLREPAYAARVSDAPVGAPYRVPSVLALQARLEAAWAQGRDREGAAHYAGAFLTPALIGSSALIGSGEVATILRAASVPAQHVAFHAFDDKNLEQLLPREKFAKVSAMRCRAAEELQRAGGRSPAELLSVGVQPPRTAAERLYLYRRHAALLSWLFCHFSVRVPYDERVHWDSSGRDATAGPGAGAGAGGVGSAANGGRGRIRMLSDPRVQAPYLLYLQHDGHSRALAGFEVTVSAGALDPKQSRLEAFSGAKRPRADELFNDADVISGDMSISLLLLDPSVPRLDLERKLGQGAGWQPLVKRGLHTMRHAHYELVWVPHPTDPLSSEVPQIGGPPKRLFSGL